MLFFTSFFAYFFPNLFLFYIRRSFSSNNLEFTVLPKGVYSFSHHDYCMYYHSICMKEWKYYYKCCFCCSVFKERITFGPIKKDQHISSIQYSTWILHLRSSISYIALLVLIYNFINMLPPLNYIVKQGFHSILIYTNVVAFFPNYRKCRFKIMIMIILVITVICCLLVHIIVHIIATCIAILLRSPSSFQCHHHTIYIQSGIGYYFSLSNLLTPFLLPPFLFFKMK